VEAPVRKIFYSHLRKNFSGGGCSSELWSKGCRCLSWRQAKNPLVDTSSDGSLQAGGLLGLSTPGWPRGLLQQSLKQKAVCGRSSGRPWRRTFGWPQGSSGKSSGDSGRESRAWPIVKPQLQEEQCRFYPGHVTVDQLFTLAGLLGGHGSLPIQSACALWTWRRLMTVFPGDTCHSVLVQTKCELHPYYRHKIKHVLSGCWTPPRFNLLTDSVRDLHGQNLKAQPR